METLKLRRKPKKHRLLVIVIPAKVVAVGGVAVTGTGALLLASDMQGYNNASGHYAPTIEQGKYYPNLLNELGVRTKNAWLILGDYSLTESGYVDVETTQYYTMQLN